jgi:spermidine dehydrogenase
MQKKDKLLGIDRAITRRDFVGSVLVGSGSALISPYALGQAAIAPSATNANSDAAAWTGYGGVGDYATSNGNTHAVVSAAHFVRDAQKGDRLAGANPTGETFDVVVVGGGFSGLGAAFQFQAKTEGKSCLMLDNHPVFGGEAKENEFEVDGHRLFGPQGSNAFIIPTGRTTLSDDVWRAVGMPTQFEFADSDNDFGLKTARDSYESMFWGEPRLDVGHLFRDGDQSRWEKNIWSDDLKRTPWSAELRRDMLRGFKGRETVHGAEDLGPWLDSMTYQTYLDEKLGLDPGVSKHLDPILAISNYGFGCDVISAYGAYLLELPGMKGYAPADYDKEAVHSISFPGGNSTYARYIVKHLIPDAISGDGLQNIALGRINFAALDHADSPTRIRLGATAADVRHVGDKVQVTYQRAGKMEQVFAKSVVMSTAGMMARTLVNDMPVELKDNYAQINHGPVLVVNVALNNWRFLAKLGFTAARWYDGFGAFGSIRAPMRLGNQIQPYDPDKPIVMTFYVPFNERGEDIRNQGNIGRARLLSKDFLTYEREIRSHMNNMFAAGGFDAKRDIAGIILNRWGHAYVAPHPGFYFGGADGAGLAAPMKKGHGRIFYGHSELGSRMNYRNAIAEGGRAGGQAAAIV